MPLGFLRGVPSQFCPSPPPPLPFQIIKAYLDYSVHHQLAGYQGIWSKYEVMAIKQIINLPLKGEGIEIVTYVADTLGYNKLLAGHLELAIDLGKGWLSKRGHADSSNTQKYTAIVFSSGSRAQTMWGLLQNPNNRYKVLSWLTRPLFLKNRYLILKHFPKLGGGSHHNGMFWAHFTPAIP